MYTVPLLTQQEDPSVLQWNWKRGSSRAAKKEEMVENLFDASLFRSLSPFPDVCPTKCNAFREKSGRQKEREGMQ